MVFDISDRKQAEEARRQSEERFRRYFELSLVGKAITSPDKSWLEVNDRLCEMLGYSRSELTRLTWAEVTHPADLELSNRSFDAILAGESEGYSFDKRFIRKDGQIVHASVSVKCLRRADGSVDCLLGAGTGYHRPQAGGNGPAPESRRAERRQRRAGQGRPPQGRISGQHESRTAYPLTGILNLSEALQEQIYGPLTKNSSSRCTPSRKAGDICWS